MAKSKYNVQTFFQLSSRQALGAGLGFLYWLPEQWFEVVMRFYALLIIFPMVRFYVYRRERSRMIGA
jgi:hypothetical protein